MHPFAYILADEVASAVALMTTDSVARAVQTPADTAYPAGGTTQYDLMRDGIWSPGTVVDGSAGEDAVRGGAQAGGMGAR